MRPHLINGDKFNKWTIMHHHYGGAYYAICDCGKIQQVRRNTLETGKSRSCLKCRPNVVSKIRKLKIDVVYIRRLRAETRREFYRLRRIDQKNQDRILYCLDCGKRIKKNTGQKYYCDLECRKIYRSKITFWNTEKKLNPTISKNKAFAKFNLR